MVLEVLGLIFVGFIVAILLFFSGIAASEDEGAISLVLSVLGFVALISFGYLFAGASFVNSVAFYGLLYFPAI